MAAPVVEASVVGSTADQASFTLTSWTPAADELVLVGVACRASAPTTPVVSGNGYSSFTQVATVVNVQTQFSLWLFRALTTGTPSTGSLTVTSTGNTKPMSAIAARISGVATGGTNGADAVEASATDAGPDPDDDDMLSSITTLSANSMVVAVGSSRLRDFTVPAHETAIQINNAAGSGGDQTKIHMWYEVAVSAGSTQLGDLADLSSDSDWAMILASITDGEVAAAGPPGAIFEITTHGAFVF